MAASVGGGPEGGARGPLVEEIFIWSGDFDTGIGVIDRQHRQLVEQINAIVQIAVSGKQVKEEEVGRIKAELSNYVEAHFATEEEMMARLAVDERHVRQHRFLHGEFVSKVQGFFAEGRSIDGKALAEVSEYLIRWLAYHILNIDMGLARQIAAIKAGSDPARAFDVEQSYLDTNTEPLLKALRALFFLVSEKNRELEQLNAELEHKVRQRTQELEEANRRLELISMQDELTRLPNRRFALLSLDQLLSERERYSTPLSVMLVDADKFKAVNDNFGHDRGDAVIKWIGDFLKQNLRKSDIVCRLGGDEFLVICPLTDAEAARKAGEALVARSAALNATNPLEFWKISLSVGVAEASVEDSAAVIKRADAAMYLAKKGGGGRVASVPPSGREGEGDE